MKRLWRQDLNGPGRRGSAAELLTVHFPHQPDDSNELPDKVEQD